ncbi:MAG: SoxR reducing system RseC family protein [Acidobacteria bacterium]|nr:SoxR reducing system RseC family protein [Acidobacteriota bacterium]
MTLLAILSGMLGAFLFVWTLSIRRLSVAQQPAFSKAGWFVCGVPLLGMILFMGGFGLALGEGSAWGLAGLAITVALGILLLRHDSYSAMARILFDDYLSLKKENPGSSDFDLFYSIVKSRRPRWNEDRIMEFCAGKDVQQLVLLLLLTEYEIHPLNDMQLYERLKTKVEALAPRL